MDKDQVREWAAAHKYVNELVRQETMRKTDEDRVRELKAILAFATRAGLKYSEDLSSRARWVALKEAYERRQR